MTGAGLSLLRAMAYLSSFFTPRATICSASAGRGRCSAFASCHGARSWSGPSRRSSRTAASSGTMSRSQRRPKHSSPSRLPPPCCADAHKPLLLLERPLSRAGLIRRRQSRRHLRHLELRGRPCRYGGDAGKEQGGHSGRRQYPKDHYRHLHVPQRPAHFAMRTRSPTSSASNRARLPATKKLFLRYL